VATNVDPFTGIVTFKKAGSIYVTPDAVFQTPSSESFTPGRFLITGSRYGCSCQDFTHRDYSFISSSAGTDKKFFARSSASVIKPGRLN
jgi:hypothetical protein